MCLVISPSGGHLCLQRGLPTRRSSPHPVGRVCWQMSSSRFAFVLQTIKFNNLTPRYRVVSASIKMTLPSLQLHPNHFQLTARLQSSSVMMRLKSNICWIGFLLCHCDPHILVSHRQHRVHFYRESSRDKVIL